MHEHHRTPLRMPQQYPSALIAFAHWIVVYLLFARLLPYFDQEAVYRQPSFMQEKQVACVQTTALNMQTLSSFCNFITKTHSVLRRLVISTG